MTELPPDVRHRATTVVCTAMRNRQPGSLDLYNAVVDAVAEVLATAERPFTDAQWERAYNRQGGEIIGYQDDIDSLTADRDALKARVAELEGALRLTSALVGDGEDERNALKIVSGAEIDALKARVDLLTTALTELVALYDGTHPMFATIPRSIAAGPITKVFEDAHDRARAALSATPTVSED